MKTYRRIYRLFALVLFVLLAVLLTVIVSPPGINTPPGALHKKLRQWWLKTATRIIGIHLSVSGNQNVGAALWVANHISWLDIPVIGGAGHVEFLSKSEIRQWPVIGWLAKKSGTLFINRGRKNASQNASQKISERIIEGRSVLVFPEATTTDGSDVKRFHARLFAPVLDHQLSMQPIAIRYLDKHGKRHPQAAFINGDTFIPSLLRILGEPRITAEVIFLPALSAENFSERKALASAAQTQIKAVITAQTEGPPKVSSK
jgi:1-acyl-sn-glycerol-3-phosphate acyltransferase